MDLNRACIIDIETNGLLADMLDYKEFPYRLKSSAKLWCVSIRNVATSEVKSAVMGEITREWLQEVLSEYDYIIAHNGIKFDLPTLKLFGLLDYRIGYLGQSDTMYGRDVVFIDTLILSRLFSPDRYNGHSLESWGIRVGSEKTDFRGLCIEKGYIDAKAPKGAEFRSFCPEMVEYCDQDTLTNLHTFNLLVEEMSGYKGWARPIVVEKKLADQAVCRENLGFFFDKPAAVALLKDLTEKMEAIERTILPILPPKKMGKTEIKNYILPKKQFTKDGSLTKGVITKVEKMGGMLTQDGSSHKVLMGDKLFTLPYHEPLQTHVEASMKDLDHIKMYLISLGWVPTEWRERDITKDTKKQKLSIEKRREVLNRWYQETMDGKYKEARLDHLNMSEHGLYEFFEEKLHSEWPVRVPTSPSVRVGVEKELCPNLTALGDKVAFAKDFALYLTYKHRKSSIAGGEIEDMDFDIEYPNTGFLSMYREEDQRVPTPAIEIGTNTFRYRHVGISNIARATSIYGKEMRSLFGSGKNGLQFGYDFSSLEARIQGHYCWKYPGGQELAETLLAEKPLDLHTLCGLRLGIPRSDAKSINYAILYGSSWNKIMKMLVCSPERAKEIVEGFWDSMPALKALKANVEAHWEANDKKFVVGIDGRKINIRSKHSILNALFQSAGVISAKYVNVLSMQKLEELGYCINPFEGIPDVCEMIAYHDECQLFCGKSLFDFPVFETEDEAKAFVADFDSTEGQLSAISEGKKWYVCQPNVVSKSIEESIKDTERILKLNVELGYEWIVNTTWYGCH